MKIGIMQPYLFPYLGYFQLINVVDIFVVYGDVQYMKKAWINRNKIQVKRNPNLFTFAVKKDAITLNINQRFYYEDTYYSTREKFLKTLFLSYHKAPHFKEANELITDILNYKDLNISEFNTNSLRKICNYMNINTQFISSSSLDLEKVKGLKAQERCVEVNKLLGGSCYINSIGGLELYSPEKFEENGIRLRFIRMRDVKYPQFDEQFIPNLSIIDVLMFNSQEEIEKLLNSYELVSKYEQ